MDEGTVLSPVFKHSRTTTVFNYVNLSYIIPEERESRRSSIKHLTLDQVITRTGGFGKH